MAGRDILAGYAGDAGDLIPRYEALRTPDVLAAVLELIAANGRLLLSIRHGPGARTRPCLPCDVDETIGRAEGAKLELVTRRETGSMQQENRAAGVRWTWPCMERS